MMHLIIYSSKFSGSEQSATQTLKDIVDVASQRNKSLGVSGVLLFQNGYFLQALEGEKETLKKLFEEILGDPRHDQIAFHADQPISERSFENWTMDAFELDNPSLFDPDTVGIIQKLYTKSFEMNPKAMIEFIKKIIDEIDTFKIQLDLKPKFAKNRSA